LIVGYHAPPPGAPTGVADYAATLREALQAFAPPGADVDVNVYHLGNNRLHAGIYAKAIATPGVVVLHDAVLHHFLLGVISREEYIEEFVYNYGEWGRHIGEELWGERGACAIDPRYFRYPMLRRAVENARAVIVHNPAAAEIARAHRAKNIHVIPHFFEQQSVPDAFEVERFRQRISVVPQVALFGIFGYLRETKRVLPCLRAFRRLHALRPNTALFIAGDVVSGDLERSLANEPAHPAIHRLPHLSETDFRIAAAAVDCCLNLRYPAAGETSGIAIRLMGTGKPVIVTEGPETSGIPAVACLRDPAGADEADALFDQMAFAVEFPALARRIGQAAAEHIHASHTLENAARRFWQVIESVRQAGGGLTSAA